MEAGSHEPAFSDPSGMDPALSSGPAAPAPGAVSGPSLISLDPRNSQGIYRYYFNIGSVEAFERQLEEAHDHLRVDPSHRVPVIYTQSAISEDVVIGTAINLLFVVAGIALLRSAMRSMGSGGPGEPS